MNMIDLEFYNVLWILSMEAHVRVLIHENRAEDMQKVIVEYNILYLNYRSMEKGQ